MARNEYTAQNIKWNITDYKEEDEESIESIKRKLEKKRERIKYVWRMMDQFTRDYDKLLQEIDDLVCKIKKHERENSSN